jgi:hypothetical protein
MSPLHISIDSESTQVGATKALRRLALALPLALGLASCGGGYSSSGTGLSCSVPDQETWLAEYFSSDYLWAATSPNFPPQTDTAADYFPTLLYTGGDPTFPAGVTDVWSSFTSDDNWNLLYVNGQDLGYGVFVNGLEAEAGGATLAVRYVDPGSPADVAGIARGDDVISINGVPAATLVASGDFSALASDSTGQTVTLVTSNAAGTHTNTLTSVAYALTPVQGARVFTSPTGRTMGYLMVTDAIDQALAPYDQAFAQFKSAGVQDVVVDLRYTGSGTVADGETMASYPDTSATSGQVYANLYFNQFIADVQDEFFTFDPETNGLALPRVFVLTGPRTCGVAEQFVNGLSPLVTVVTVGDTTCGKPLGSTPASNCGTTYSIMTFQVTNGANSGQYFSGLPASCPVAEDLSVAIGDDADPLLAGAVTYADTGACPAGAMAAGAGARHAMASRLEASWLEPMDRHGAISR